MDEATQIRGRRQQATGSSLTLLPILRARVLPRNRHTFRMPHAHTTVTVSNHTPPLLSPLHILFLTASTTMIPRETPEGTVGIPATPAGSGHTNSTPSKSRANTPPARANTEPPSLTITAHRIK